jgi:hypothetical protein
VKAGATFHPYVGTASRAHITDGFETAADKSSGSIKVAVQPE